MKRKLYVSVVLMLVLSMVLTLGGAVAAAGYVHGVFSERAVYVVDGLTGTVHQQVRGHAIASWTENPLSSGNQAFFNAIVHSGLTGDVYEFRLVALAGTTNDSIHGIFHIYKNSVLVAIVSGTVVGLSQPVGGAYKFYDASNSWHTAGVITDRLDY